MRRKPRTAFKKGHKKRAGRQRGTRNRLPLAAKQAIELAFEGLGGVDGLIKWAKSSSANMRAFYTQLFAKLLPLQVNANISGTSIRHITDNMTDKEAVAAYVETVKAINGTTFLNGYIEDMREEATSTKETGNGKDSTH